ncbi:O-antigen translocase [Luteimonas dalianensis]|uniref:O-antigen translocase n=1 Tax=Luteimonas dalianensis TaxID=1148196 RepID=UPI003BF3161C
MGNSYRQILRSSSIIGGASVINIMVGLLRMKAAAVLLGPAGVGLIGLFTNLVGTATAVAGVGVGTVGTRQIAEAAGKDDPQRIALVRRALFWLTLGLAVLGGVAFWLLRHVLAERVLGDASLGGALGWLSIAVVFSVAAASQNALLRGVRRVGDIARISVGSAVLSTFAALIALWAFGRDGIVVFVLAAPVASFLLGYWYVSRLPRVSPAAAPLAQFSSQWRAMLGLGVAFMVAGLAASVGQLLVRTLVQRELGVEALGHFQAAWAISMTYVGFVLGAMGTDYYPRLTAVIQDRVAVNRLVNEQTEVALLLAAPVLLGMLALAPWVIRLLYTSEFVEAVDVLRWQVLGDILKVASWPLGFILLASGAGKTFMGTEWMAVAMFVVLTFVLLPVIGIDATGIAFLGMYLVLLALVYLLAVRRTGFAWSPAVKRLLAVTFLAAVGITALASATEVLAGLLGSLAAAGFGTYALVRLSHASELRGPVAKLASVTKTMMTRMGVWRD